MVIKSIIKRYKWIWK